MIIAANKADTPDKTSLASEFYALGWERYSDIIENGGGTGELLDELVKVFEAEDVENPERAFQRLLFSGDRM